MPQYIFQSGKLFSEFFFKMNDAPSIGSEVKIEGKVWKRIPSLPQASFDTSVNAFSDKDLMGKTNKQSTLGDLQDFARDMSDKRKQKEGFDQKQKDYFKSWSKLRCGRLHPEDRGD